MYLGYAQGAFDTTNKILVNKTSPLVTILNALMQELIAELQEYLNYLTKQPTNIANSEIFGAN